MWLTPSLTVLAVGCGLDLEGLHSHLSQASRTSPLWWGGRGSAVSGPVLPQRYPPEARVAGDPQEALGQPNRR